MPEERFQRVQGRLDDWLAQGRREEYEQALARFRADAMCAVPERGLVPTFNYKAKAPEVENIFCNYHFYIRVSCNAAMFPTRRTNSSDGCATLACGCDEHHKGSTGGPFSCNFSERDLRIDTKEKKVVVRFEGNQYVCPYFKPTEEVLAMAERQLKALDGNSNAGQLQSK